MVNLPSSPVFHISLKLCIDDTNIEILRPNTGIIDVLLRPILVRLLKGREEGGWNPPAENSKDFSDFRVKSELLFCAPLRTKIVLIFSTHGSG